MRKKLLVILGAGSSISGGMPSVSELDGLVEKWSDAWAAKHGFSNHYRALKTAMENYYGQGAARPKPSLNFETILGQMVALSHWMTPAPFGDPLRQVACEGAAPPNLTFSSASLFGGPAPYAATVEVTDQLTHILVELAKCFRSRCIAINSIDEVFSKYRALDDALCASFDVGIYNLNYDTLAEMAWPGAYTGFDAKGEFDAAMVHRRQEWGFVYHLHGSVHHALNQPTGGDRIVWRNDLSASFNDGYPGRPGDKRSEGRELPITTLVAGGFKLDQLLVEPFHSLHAALVRHVYEADAVLIGGYGFSDEHVNRALRNRLAGRVAKERGPVMVLDRADDRADPMACRYDHWAHNLIRSLQAPGDFFREPGHAAWPAPPKALAAKGAFEVSREHRVALWHGGFVEAVSRLDAMVAWLFGADDMVLAAPEAQ